MNAEEKNPLTEYDAAVAYASACNRHDPTEFIELIAPNATYTSFLAREPLKGKEVIAGYISGIMKNQGNIGMELKAEVAWVFEDIQYLKLALDEGSGSHMRDCVLLKQDGDKDHDRLAIFGVEEYLITIIDILFPYSGKLCYAIRK